MPLPAEVKEHGPELLLRALARRSGHEVVHCTSAAAERLKVVPHILTPAAALHGLEKRQLTRDASVKISMGIN